MKAILEETDIHRACALGRECKFEKAFYDMMLCIWMRDVLKAKFNQNPEFKAALLATEGTTLALATEQKHWGIGWHKDNPNAQKRTNWCHQNLLGELLTETRVRITKKY